MYKAANNGNAVKFINDLYHKGNKKNNIRKTNNMDNLEEAEVIEKIQKEEHITFDIKEKYFKGKSFKEIRNWLEIHNIDRHITIDIKSAGVIILISSLNENNKVLVQVRASEKARLGIFGGGIEKNETPIQAAIRELEEETGIKVCEEQLEFLEINEHDLKYENGDKAHYVASLYLLKLSEYPIIKLDRESNGILVISKDNYNDYINMNDTNSLQLHICWQDIISRILGI